MRQSLANAINAQSDAVSKARTAIYLPDLALGGPDDTGNRGVLIPTTSLDQFGATCAKWFGVTPQDMPTVFPNLGNFATADVGFMV